MNPKSVSRKGPRKHIVPVEAREDIGEIIDAILDGDSDTSVCRRFGIHPVALRKYIRDKLSLAIKDGEARARLETAAGVRARLMSHLVRIEKMYDACEEFLTDPDDPGRYYLGPRANEIKVVYYVRCGEKTERRTAPLDELLEKAMQGEPDTVLAYDHTIEGLNPRKLILDTANVTTKQLEVIGKLLDGADRINASVPLTTSEVVVQIQQIFVRIIKDDPAMAPLLTKLETALEDATI